MDFSKIKKLFYIVCIISMLLSIKNKVFATSDYDYTFKDTTDSFSLFPLSDYYVFCYGKKRTSDYQVNIIVSDSPFTITNNNATLILADNSKYWNFFGATSLNSLNNTLQNFTAPTFDVTSSTKYQNTFINTWVGQNIFTNFDLKNENGEVVNNSNVFSSPFFDNLTEIENGYPDGVFISRGDYSEDTPLYFHLLKITNTVPDGNQSTYYYDSKVFKLIKDSKYYKTYDTDTENKYSYYYIERSALTLDTNSSYLYVLSNSGDSISNSYGILQPDSSLGIYDVVVSDTAGVITEQQALNDKITNMDQNFNDYKQQQQEFQNQNTILPETETDISNNLQFNNSTPQFSNLFNEYFSQLTSLVADLGNYNDKSVLTINLPIPHTNTNVPIRSDVISSHLPADIYFIVQMVWYFIFGKYFVSFILKIYNLFATGSILDYYSTNGEVITHDML